MPQRQLVLSQKRYGCFHSERVPSQAARRYSHKDVDYSRFLLVSESNGPLSHEPCPHQATASSCCSMTFNDGINTVKRSSTLYMYVKCVFAYSEKCVSSGDVMSCMYH